MEIVTEVGNKLMVTQGERQGDLAAAAESGTWFIMFTELN